jgi:hypothetical protein
LFNVAYPSWDFSPIKKWPFTLRKMKYAIIACTLSLVDKAMSVAVVPAKNALAFLGTNASQLNCKKKVGGPPKGSAFGKNKCPCVGIDNLRGYFAVELDFHHVQYPLEVGASCDEWDKGYNPACEAAIPPSWCNQKWCYVDPCECELDVTPKKTQIGLEYQGHAAFWSYDTCGNFDFFSADTSKESCASRKDSGACSQKPDCGWDGKQCLDKEALATCEKKQSLNAGVYGKEDCRCVGFSGHQNGAAVMYINDNEQVAYPPDVGGTCGAWESTAHPDCKKDGAKPQFCSQKWCFVDPCKCSGGVPPRTVMTANGDMRFQGKTAYWSYDTCGSVDEWSKNLKGEYCVTQKNRRSLHGIGEVRLGWQQMHGQSI